MIGIESSGRVSGLHNKFRNCRFLKRLAAPPDGQRPLNRFCGATVSVFKSKQTSGLFMKRLIVV
jgi:hypothetical protein